MPRGLQAAKSEIATTKVLDAALELFSTRGYGATSMRQIAEACDQSVGNLYHHFGSKEAIYQELIRAYFDKLEDPDHPLRKIFNAARFPDDLEELAAAIEQTVDEEKASIMLVFIDVIEHGGRHIRSYYQTMADRFREVYGGRFAELERQGRLSDADPLVAVMVATRWLFYFYTVEKCFGVPMHFGMDAQQAVDGFIRILRNGLLRGAERAAAADDQAMQGERRGRS